MFVPVGYAGVGFIADDPVQATGVPFEALAWRDAFAG